LKSSSVTKQRLGWFPCDWYLIQYSPSLDTIELEIKKLFLDVFAEISKLAVLYKDFEPIIENQYFVKVESKKIEPELESFLFYAFIGLYSFLAMLLKFEFYLIFQKQHYSYCDNLIEKNVFFLKFSFNSRISTVFSKNTSAFRTT